MSQSIKNFLKSKANESVSSENSAKSYLNQVSKNQVLPPILRFDTNEKFQKSIII